MDFFNAMEDSMTLNVNQCDRRSRMREVMFQRHLHEK